MICLPGKRLSTTKCSSSQAGPGTEFRNGVIYSTVAGQFTQISNSSETLFTVSSIGGCHIPKVGNIYECFVCSLSENEVQVLLIAFQGNSLSNHFVGVIRLEEIAKRIKRPSVLESYRVGDILRAKLISIGSTDAYELSTVDEDLGVVFAKSDQNAVLEPLNLTKMKCPISGLEYLRKIAVQTNSVETASKKSKN